MIEQRSVNVPVDISGYADTLKAMRKFDEDLYKGMQKQIKDVMIPIRDKARAYAPSNSEMLSGWTKAGTSSATINYRAFPKYDQSETRKGITYRAAANKRNKGTAFNVSYYVANRTAGGAIYETSGRKNPGGQPSQASRAGKFSDYKDTTNKVNKSLNPNAGRQFISSMGPIFGPNQPMQGRLIYRAWAEDQGRVSHAVNLAIDTAVNIFNATNTTDSFNLAA
jgi:hypothetical protein